MVFRVLPFLLWLANMFFFFFDNTTSSEKIKSNPIVLGEDASFVQKKERNVPSTTVTQRERIESNSSSFEHSVKYVSSSEESTSDANLINERFLSKLDADKEGIIYLMLHTSIEDGYDNEVVEYMRPYFNESKYMTLFWLYGLYAQYMSNQWVFAAILNLLSCLDVKQRDMSSMVSLVSNGLNSKYSIVQEAAIKVVEKWRSKECLEAMRQSTFSSSWMMSYAKRVIQELEIEHQ